MTTFFYFIAYLVISLMIFLLCCASSEIISVKLHLSGCNNKRYVVTLFDNHQEKYSSSVLPHIYEGNHSHNGNNVLLNTTAMTKKIGSDNQSVYMQLWIFSNNQIYSTIISDDQEFAGGLPSIHFNENMFIKLQMIFASLIYTSRDDALVLNNFSVPFSPCSLKCHTFINGHNFTSSTSLPPSSSLLSTAKDDVDTKQVDSPTNTLCKDKNDDSQQIVLTYQYPSSTSTPRYVDIVGGYVNESVALQKCYQQKSVVFIGDSHTEKLFMLLTSHDTGKWKFLFDGTAIYHNIGADRDYQRYISGKSEALFVKGYILSKFDEGGYDRHQKTYRPGVWVFSSCAWDLRDSTVEVYRTHVRELFGYIRSFQARHGFSFKVIWNSCPAWSYLANSDKPNEKRTNPKTALANKFTETLCQEYNFTYIDMFRPTLPFYQTACDTHHYLCSNYLSSRHQLGLPHLNLLLDAVCA